MKVKMVKKVNGYNFADVLISGYEYECISVDGNRDTEVLFIHKFGSGLCPECKLRAGQSRICKENMKLYADFGEAIKIASIFANQ